MQDKQLGVKGNQCFSINIIYEGNILSTHKESYKYHKHGENVIFGMLIYSIFLHIIRYL